MCGWAKNEMGWVTLVEVGSNLSPYSIDNVEFNRPVYRLGIMHERWRRMTECAIISLGRMGDEDETLAHTEGRVNVPGTEIRVVRDDGSTAAAGSGAVSWPSIPTRVSMWSSIFERLRGSMCAR